MREHFYQKTWFKNTVLILIPSAISVVGVFMSAITSSFLRLTFIFVAILLMVILIIYILYSSSHEDKIFEELKKAQDDNAYLTNILAHMENNYKTVTSEVAAFSETAETWAKMINSFANNVKANGYISDKAWDKEKITDSICLFVKDIIQQYCNSFDNANVSVGYIAYTQDQNGEEWLHMTSHSNPISLRPNACRSRVKLSECNYHYADLIKDKISDLDIAMDNDEILRIFKKVSLTSDLGKYTQYIAIPLYCKSGKLLGILQIVTKNGYIIEHDKIKLEQFIIDSIIPFGNLIILTDKIYKGLYIAPKQINKEV